MLIEQVSNSYIYYDNTQLGYVKDYYNYIISLIKKILLGKSINIIIGNHSINFNNTNKTIRVHINYEHTLVKYGGRTSGKSPFGTIPVIDSNSDTYLVRVINLNEAMNSDIIIDYSIPNIINITKSNIYNGLIDKLVYIPPILYPLYSEMDTRDINILTTFINTNEPRRKALINMIHNNNMSHININNCFDKDELQKLYLNTKVLINIHQTDHHHTFEELRVLPALLCGIIVVCEDSPLKDTIPYNDYVVWATYDSIITIVNNILLNYDIYHKIIFSNKPIHKLIETMEENTINTLDKLFNLTDCIPVAVPLPQSNGDAVTVSEPLCVDESDGVLIAESELPCVPHAVAVTDTELGLPEAESILVCDPVTLPLPHIDCDEDEEAHAVAVSEPLCVELGLPEAERVLVCDPVTLPLPHIDCEEDEDAHAVAVSEPLCVDESDGVLIADSEPLIESVEL